MSQRKWCVVRVTPTRPEPTREIVADGFDLPEQAWCTHDQLTFYGDNAEGVYYEVVRS